MSVSNALARQFYMEMCRIEHWSTRTLDEKIDAQLFERTAISRKPDEVIKAELEKSKEKNEIQPDMVFRSSYFLGLNTSLNRSGAFPVFKVSPIGHSRGGRFNR